MTKTVIVTGTSGFIGDVVAESLTRDGFQVLGIDKVPHSGSPSYKTLTMDLSTIDPSIINSVINSSNPDAIIHCAASTSVVDAEKDPSGTVRNNVEVTVRLMDGLSRMGSRRKFVFLSTGGAMYQLKPGERGSYDKTPSNPVGIYGASKLAAEKLVEYYNRSRKLNTSIFRLANVIGAHPKSKSVIGVWIRRLLRGEPIVAFSGDEEGAKQTIRDYVDVKQVVKAVTIPVVYKNFRADPNHMVYDIGSSTSTSLYDIIMILREFFDDVKVEYKPRRPGELVYSVLEGTTKLIPYHWIPEKPDLRKIISDMIELEKSQELGVGYGR